MWHFNTKLPDHQENAIKRLKEQVGLTYSELVRRMFDYSLRPQVLNEIIPSMSGQLGSLDRP